MMKEGCCITEHEALMANQLAKVMTGGEWSRRAGRRTVHPGPGRKLVHVSLRQESKARMWNVLQTGKVVRN